MSEPGERWRLTEGVERLEAIRYQCGCAVQVDPDCEPIPELDGGAPWFFAACPEHHVPIAHETLLPIADDNALLEFDA